MRRSLQVLSVGATLLLAGCAGHLATLSSGHIGCSPDEIVIENEEWSWGTRTWVARCGDRVYYCSSQAGSTHETSPRVFVVSSPQVSCRRRGGDGPSAPTYTPPPSSGCDHDNQCKGDRLCVDGRCVDPGPREYRPAPRPEAEEPPPRPAGPPRAPARPQARDSEAPPD